eukprot:2750773-Prymnesium_polylepis.1
MCIRDSYNTIETASAGSKALQNGTWEVTQVGHAGAGRRAGCSYGSFGRPHGDAIDGTVLVGRQRIMCDLASLPPRPYHVCTPPPR